MAVKLFECSGGNVALPAKNLVLVDRMDGGNLIVSPAREVWERSELSATELTFWSFLVAATGRAMLEVLPQLAFGCINYWEAGNWALNDLAVPAGRKSGPQHRRVHLHLLGRSRDAAHPAWRWGEAPKFPDFADRHGWAENFEQLRPEECLAIVARTAELLVTRYRVPAGDIAQSAPCSACGYPAIPYGSVADLLCDECRPETVTLPG